MKKIEYSYQQIDFEIVKYDIPLCCQIFFWGGWSRFRREIPEYGELLTSNETGIVKCPECLIKELRNE